MRECPKSQNHVANTPVQRHNANVQLMYNKYVQRPQSGGKTFAGEVYRYDIIL